MEFIKFLFLILIFAIIGIPTLTEAKTIKKKSPCDCTLDFGIVCGSDGINYINLCLLECQQSVDSTLTKVNEGECEREMEETKAPR